MQSLSVLWLYQFVLSVVAEKLMKLQIKLVTTQNTLNNCFCTHHYLCPNLGRSNINLRQNSERSNTLILKQSSYFPKDENERKSNFFLIWKLDLISLTYWSKLHFLTLNYLTYLHHLIAVLLILNVVEYLGWFFAKKFTWVNQNCLMNGVMIMLQLIWSMVYVKNKCIISIKD